MTVFGTSVRRVEDVELLRGAARFVADVDLPGVAHVEFVTSPLAHGRIVRIDTSAASQVDGVLAVVTGAELDLGLYPAGDDAWPAMTRPMLATDTVRFVGEPVVAIVAESAAAASDARDLVELDFDPLPVVVDVEAALTTDVLLFPDLDSNVVTRSSNGDGTFDPDGHEVTVRRAFRSQRIAPCPMEARAAASRWNADGRLEHWSSCQGPHPVRSVLARIYDLDETNIRVIAPHVGGSFGAKSRPYPEEVLLPWLARRVHRPVRWFPSRSDDMVGLGHSRAQAQAVELSGRRDGTIEALRLRVVGDVGAYPFGAGPMAARTTGLMMSGPYRVPAVDVDVTTVVTNTTPLTAYRGPGRAEATTILERVVDDFAAEIGMDPAEVRRRNFVETFPHTTPAGLVLDSGDYRAALELALDTIDYDAVRVEQARLRADPDTSKVLGVGIATFVDRTSGYAGSEYGAAALRPDGGLRLHTGATPSGQGHVTTWSMLASERTGVPIERIEIVSGDTDLVPRGSVTGGSKSVQRAGSAIATATDELVQLARESVAELLEAAVEDIVLDVANGGTFHVAGTPARSLSWTDLAARSDRALQCEADFFQGDSSFPFGAYVAVVEIDVETGAVTVRRFVTVDDAGRILNPLLATGQVHGGAAQGIGQALFEEFTYDDAGNPLTATFLDYGIPSAAELPSYESLFVESPSPTNPLGAKGIGESGIIGANAAVINAVMDAVRHLGVHDLDPPLSPQRVWRAMQDAASDH